MTTLSASLTLRPTRIGFLVRPDDSTSLRRIFQVCTCLWGGVHCPIIPVSATLPEAWKERHGLRNPDPIDIANGYVRFFEPDVFVEAEDGLAKQLGLAIEDLQDYGHPRLLNLDAFFTKPGPYDPDVPFGTSIFGVYKDLYEREFKFVPRHERRVALMAATARMRRSLNASWEDFRLTDILPDSPMLIRTPSISVALAPTAEKIGFRVYGSDFCLQAFRSRQRG